jgi:TolB-like protein
MSGDPEQDYFADGMAEEIITALSRCSWLFVIARNSSFTYKGQAVDVRDVGRDLGVRYVLEGSVRRAGDRLRFTGQLIDATSGGHIWADRFEGSVGNVFDLQDRFTESVVAAIEWKLQLAEIARLKHKPASNFDAYDLLLRAQQCEYEFRAESLAAALRYLEQALAIDPSYAPAMALAALCHAERRDQGWMKDQEGEAREALDLASRGTELGKDDANVLWMGGYTILRFEMEQPRAKTGPTFARTESELGHRLRDSRRDGSERGKYQRGSGITLPRNAPEPARPAGVVHHVENGLGLLGRWAVRGGDIRGQRSIEPESSQRLCASVSRREPCKARPIEGWDGGDTGGSENRIGAHAHKTPRPSDVH